MYEYFQGLDPELKGDFIMCCFFGWVIAHGLLCLFMYLVIDKYYCIMWDKYNLQEYRYYNGDTWMYRAYTMGLWVPYEIIKILTYAPIVFFIKYIANRNGSILKLEKEHLDLYNKTLKEIELDKTNVTIKDV